MSKIMSMRQMLPRNSCTKGNFASANIYINKKDAQMKKYSTCAVGI